MGDEKKEPKLAVNPEAGELLKNTESVVHETFRDVSDIGEVVDDSKVNLEVLLAEFRRFKRDYKSEIQTQIKPLADTLNKFIQEKPKAVYVIPKLPWWLKWIFKLSHIKPGGQ